MLRRVGGQAAQELDAATAVWGRAWADDVTTEHWENLMRTEATFVNVLRINGFAECAELIHETSFALAAAATTADFSPTGQLDAVAQMASHLQESLVHLRRLDLSPLDICPPGLPFQTGAWLRQTFDRWAKAIGGTPINFFDMKRQ